jgi:hypothetical protein
MKSDGYQIKNIFLKLYKFLKLSFLRISNCEFRNSILVKTIRILGDFTIRLDKCNKFLIEIMFIVI